MSGEIICGQCPAVYPAHEIDACIDDERKMTLAELQRSGSERPQRSRKFARAFLGLRDETAKAKGPKLDGLGRLRSYTFKCPGGHVVDGNPGSQFGIAVLGASGASKSHVLPALIRELDDMSALRPLGVTLRDSLYPNPKLSRDVYQVFREGHQLGPTPPQAILGPYSYKLEVNAENGHFDAAQYSLLLYDIAGENLAGITDIVEKAAFILLCKALIVLIDPEDFLPTQFDDGTGNEQSRLDAGRDVRGDIRVIADTLTEVWQMDSSRELSIPVCFMLAKADAIDWTGGYEWSTQTAQVIERSAQGDPGSVSQALAESSIATRSAFELLGGRLVIDEIEERFNPDCIRYVAASATSAMPLADPERGQLQWTDQPKPNGAALSVLQILDLVGHASRPVSLSSE